MMMIGQMYIMGNGVILFDEDKEDGTQSLLIRYTNSYFSGKATDYQNYYKTLLGLLKEVFGESYNFESSEKEKEWQTTLHPKESDLRNSPILILLSCNWMFETSPGPSIELSVQSQIAKDDN